MEGLRAWPKPPGDAPVALRWLFAERHVTAQLPLGEPRGWLKNKRPWESGHTVYKPYLAEPLVLILGRAPSHEAGASQYGGMAARRHAGGLAQHPPPPDCLPLGAR